MGLLTVQDFEDYWEEPRLWSHYLFLVSLVLVLILADGSDVETVGYCDIGLYSADMVVVPSFLMSSFFEIWVNKDSGTLCYASCISNWTNRIGTFLR